jgi:hypothetical protein
VLRKQAEFSAENSVQDTTNRTTERMAICWGSEDVTEQAGAQLSAPQAGFSKIMRKALCEAHARNAR